MKAPFSLGQVGHFGLRVRDARASADWYVANLGLDELFAFDGGVAVGSDAVTIALYTGEASPETIEHVSFHLPDMTTLRAARDFLRARGVALEDPGHEIGPEAPGSPHLGLWLHDPDGYRLELSVQNGASER